PMVQVLAGVMMLGSWECWESGGVAGNVGMKGITAIDRTRLGFTRSFLLNASVTTFSLPGWSRNISAGAFSTLDVLLGVANILSLTLDWIVMDIALTRLSFTLLFYSMHQPLHLIYRSKRRVKLRRVRAMSMTIQSSVKDKILATPSKENVVTDALSRKERVKPRRVRSMAMTIQYGHPQADGQSERMIQTLEDIMKACVINFGGSYHSSIRCVPFEALYGRKCRSPILWAEIGESSLTGLELVQETTDKVVLVKEKPKTELINVHDTLHVSNLKKKCSADANLRVPLDEIEAEKTLHFVEEPVRIMDREV
nr:putative reverse transcriptase domain-containing protein [Tanacetum cinerariifolium]